MNKIHLRSASKTFNLDSKNREKLEKKYANILQENSAKLSNPTVNDHYYKTTIKENTIMIVGLGTNVRGSMQYVLNELNSNEHYKDFKIYVRTQIGKTDEVVKQYIEQNNWNRTETVPKGYVKKLESCKYLLTESYFPYAWVKRPGQVLIDIWHGTPLKKIGLAKNGNKCHKNSIQQKNFLNSDYLLYPNTYTKNIMHTSYKITSLLTGKALMLGYPRTAGMLKVSEDRKKELLNVLAPNGEKIYAYMPTFRGYLSDVDTVAKEMELLTYLDGQLNDSQILYVNLHHHVGEALNCDKFTHIKKFPPLIDSYQLLTVTDALISDYSSVFFDYMILSKQIILYIEDYKTYSKYQGLNIDIRELPFDLAKSKEDVLDMLNRGKQYDDSQYYDAMCAYDSAQNPEKLCQLFLDDETDLCVEKIPSNNKKKVLFYTDGCVAGKSTDNLKLLTEKYDKNRFELYVGCDENKTDKNIASAYPMLHNTLMIGSVDNAYLSSVGQPLLNLYLEGKVSFDIAIEFLKYEYALMPIRMYGFTTFDTLAIYDTLNPEIIIGMALSSAHKKVLFINEVMFKEMLDGNKFMRDAIRFAAEYCNAIVVQDETYVSLAEYILLDTWNGNISFIEDVYGLLEILGID